MTQPGQPHDPDSTCADVNASDLGLASRSFSVRGGREGLVALEVRYDEIPRYFGDGAQTPFLGAGGATLTLPAGFALPGTNTMPLAANLRPIDLGYTARRRDFSGSRLGTDSLNLHMGFRRDVRDSTRPQYASFLPTAAQLPAPVEHVTDGETYKAVDWRTDGLIPAALINLLTLGTQTPRYRVGAVSVSLRYTF